MREPLEPGMIKQILELDKQKVNITEISRQLNIDRKSVYKYIVLYRPEKEFYEHKRVQPEEIELIKDLYLNKGLTPTEISRQTGINYTRVKHIMKNYKIKKKGYYGEKEYNVPMPPLKHILNEPFYYPERKITTKKVTINGKRYIDVSEVYGI